MPYSVLSAFNEPEEFETAMRPEGWLSMLVTARGQFRARLSQIALNEIHLLAAEEQLVADRLCCGTRRPGDDCVSDWKGDGAGMRWAPYPNWGADDALAWRTLPYPHRRRF